MCIKIIGIRICLDDDQSKIEEMNFEASRLSSLNKLKGGHDWIHELNCD
jgi:hypothetical protein